jgi:hypothetical protein
MMDISARSDLFSLLRNDEITEAKRLHHRFKGELRLLDDLGWEREPEAEQFELTMAARELRPIIERVYWSAVASLSYEPDQLVEEALANLNESRRSVPGDACPARRRVHGHRRGTGQRGRRAGIDRLVIDSRARQGRDPTQDRALDRAMSAACQCFVSALRNEHADGADTARSSTDGASSRLSPPASRRAAALIDALAACGRPHIPS